MNTDFNPVSSSELSADAELPSLRKKYEALRTQYEGLNRLLEAQSQEFRATLEERDAILESNKTSSARILELELRVQTLMREHRSTEQLTKTIQELNQQLDNLTERLINEQEARKQAELALVQASDRLRRAQQSAEAAQRMPTSSEVLPIQVVEGARELVEVREPTGTLVGNLAKPGTGAVSKALSKTLASMTGLISKLEKSPGDPKLLEDLYRQSRSVNDETAQMGFLPLHQLATAVRLLFDDLRKNPTLVVASRLRFQRQAIELVALLCQKENQNKLKGLLPPRVLAIDDDPGVLQVLGEELGLFGVGLCSAQDPSQGLIALQSEHFNLIFLDIGMSTNNGLELCARIRKMEDYARVPIIFLTGLVAPALRDQALAIGGDDFIIKPFHTSELDLKAIFWAVHGQI